MSDNDLVKHLLRWLRTFDVAQQVNSIADISDGLIIGTVLARVSPKTFTNDWLDQLHDKPEMSWQSKVRNLDRIFQSVKKFLSSAFHCFSDETLRNVMELNSKRMLRYEQQHDETLRNVMELNSKRMLRYEQQHDETLRNVMELNSKRMLRYEQQHAKYNDANAIYPLLQLILGCAVNCDQKQTYIEAIMNMEESVQHALMETIQQLMSPGVTGTAGLSAEAAALVSRGGDELYTAAEEYKRLIAEKEALAQRCHDLELQNSLLVEEKTSLQTELDQSRRLSHSGGRVSLDDKTHSASPTHDRDLLHPQRTAIHLLGADPVVTDVSSDEVMSPTVANVRISQLQDQLTKLRADLYRTEGVKESLDVKLTNALTTVQELKHKCDSLTQLADQAAHLKDELDIAREELTAQSHLPSTIDQLRKRADEAVELRSRCAKLEADNRVCLTRIAELEQETRLGSNLRSQAENQRLHATDAILEASQALQRAECAEAELSTIHEELSSATREKERLMSELNRLRTCCEQLQRSVLPLNGFSESQESPASPDSNLQLTPAVQSQMLNLQEELTRLRTSYYSPETTSVGSQSVLALGDGAEELVVESFEEKEASEVSPPVADLMAAPAKELVVNESSTLECKLSEKDQNYRAVEQRYRGYLWKAREVIRLQQREIRQLAIDQNSAKSDQQSVSNGDSPEISRLRALLVEKETVIEKLERHHEQTRCHRDTEERILISAWYNLGVGRTRDSIEQKLRERTASDSRQPNSSPSTSNERVNGIACDLSFLERQRELHLKPPRGLTSVVMASK